MLAAVFTSAGIAASVEDSIFIYGAVVLFILLLIFFIFKSEKTYLKDRRIILVFVFISLFFIGNTIAGSVLEKEDEIPDIDGARKDTEIFGTVSDISFSSDNFLITTEDIEIHFSREFDNDVLKSDGKLLIYSKLPIEFNIGDRIYAKGSFYTFSPATNYGQFDQKKYYGSKGIYYKLYADECNCLLRSESLDGKIRSVLFDISSLFQEGLEVVFDKKDSGVLSAMLVGNRSELDENTKEVYKRIGIAHILSISGLHITLLGMAVFRFLMMLTGHLRASVISSLTLIMLYGILTGFSISTQRAVIMLFCLLSAKLIGRAYDGQSAAGLAALIILFTNPTQLFESGFQLSFLAVYGIFAGNELRENLKIKNRILTYLIPGCFAQLATFPIILRTYYSFSPYSVLANLILLPFMSIIVVSGLLVGIFGSLFITGAGNIFLILGNIAGGPGYYLLLIYESVSQFLLELPGADIICGCPGLAGIIAYYLIFFIMISLSRGSGEKDKKYRPCYLIGIVLMFIVVLYRNNDTVFYSVFTDVGQGLSVYIETSGKRILADGGSSNVKNVGKYRIEPFLMWRGCEHLDYIIVTHTDADHVNGITELMEDGRISVGTLVLGTNYDENEKIVSIARQNGINVMYVEAGTTIFREDDFCMEVLAPDPGFIYEDKNQASVVVKIIKGEFGMLITGDSDVYSESEYIKYIGDKDEIDVLQCPHHGSKYSSSDALINKTSPVITVISCSKRNNYGHPAAETVERLEDADSSIFYTYKDGMVIITYNGGMEFKAHKYKDDKL